MISGIDSATISANTNPVFTRKALKVSADRLDARIRQYKGRLKRYERDYRERLQVELNKQGQTVTSLRTAVLDHIAMTKTFASQLPKMAQDKLN